ncbi:MAG: RNA polymerase sigma-70 factor [Bacteroidales bacterium]
MIKDETKLVKSLLRGNILAFNTLYKEYSNRLYRFAYGYLKSEAESEELVQEVFMKIWEKRADLKKELSFKSYLFTITFNLIKKHFRARAHALEYFKSEISDGLDMETTQKITYNSLYQYIVKIVNQLPERRKIIFIKSRFEGLSVKEIAKELKISHKTVENQLTDALKYIRAKINVESPSVILLITLFIS